MGVNKPTINCDMGEGMDNDALIIPFIDVATIACGAHAGDMHTMSRTIIKCQEAGVAVGAHVSFRDTANFGRMEMNLSPEDLYNVVSLQLLFFDRIAATYDVKPFHVKPHGALYNMSARDPGIAYTVARAVYDHDPSLVLFGLSGSHSIHEAKQLGLATASEAFADRTYQDDGSLTPRSQPNALIGDEDKVVQQVLQMIGTGSVTSVNGNIIPIVADTICVHGDGEHAVEFVKAIRGSLEAIE